MRAVIQRVRSASVVVDGASVGEIGHGLLVLLGVAPSDGRAEVEWLTDKLIGLRIFADDQGKMNLSLQDLGGSALIVSQFTLYADARKGRRPSFVGAAPPELALPLYDALCDAVRQRGVTVERGIFGADMTVSLVNDGPVTLVLDTP